MNLTAAIMVFMLVSMTACTSTAGIGTAPGLYQGPNLDGSAGFVVE